jgi:hypothetical protein
MADEGMALLDKAAGQGHAYATYALGCVHKQRKEYEQAMGWMRKAAETGLPKAMCHLGIWLDQGEVVAPDYPAARYWCTRASDAGDGVASETIGHMYTVGRGRASQIMPPRQSPHCGPSSIELCGVN